MYTYTYRLQYKESKGVLVSLYKKKKQAFKIKYNTWRYNRKPSKY